MKDGKLGYSNQPFVSVDDLVRDLTHGGVREVLYAFADKSPIWTDLDKRLGTAGIRVLRATEGPVFKQIEIDPGEFKFVLPD